MRNSLCELLLNKLFRTSLQMCLRTVSWWILFPMIIVNDDYCQWFINIIITSIMAMMTCTVVHCCSRTEVHCSSCTVLHSSSCTWRHTCIIIMMIIMMRMMKMMMVTMTCLLVFCHVFRFAFLLLHCCADLLLKYFKFKKFSFWQWLWF